MKALVIHRAARAELDEAMGYYEGLAAGLGLDLQAEVERAAGRLQRHPEHCAPHGRTGYRKCFVERFPYTIFFLELPEFIWVLAIAHQSRRPGYWRGRTVE